MGKAAGDKKVEVIKASKRETDDAVDEGEETLEGSNREMEIDKPFKSSKRKTGDVKVAGADFTAVGDWKIRIRIEKLVI